MKAYRVYGWYSREKKFPANFYDKVFISGSREGALEAAINYIAPSEEEQKAGVTKCEKLLVHVFKVDEAD